MSTSQLGSPKLRVSVRTQRTDSIPSVSQAIAKLETASSREKLTGRISAPPKRSSASSPFSEVWKVICTPRTKSLTVPSYQSAASGGDVLVNSTRMRGLRAEVAHPSTTLQKLSADELMFVSHIYNWGLSQARLLAARFRYKVRQPLPVLLAALHELDKNCRRQNGVRTRLSSSPVSSSRRSSTE